MLESRGLAAERRASLTATGGVSASTNPYLSTGKVVQALLTELSLRPVLTSKTSTSSVELSGTLSYRDYSQEYGSTVSGVGSISASIRKSARLEVSGSASYRHEDSAEVTDDVAGAVDPQSVRKSLGGNLSASWRMSEYEVFAPNISAQHVSYSSSDELDGYDSISGSAGYRRRLSFFTTVGLSGGAQFYMPRDGSSSTALSTTATIEHKLSAILEIGGGLGVQHVTRGDDDSGDDDGGSDGGIYPVANARLCHRGEWTSSCLTGAIASEPSGRGSLERRMSAGISYARRLSEFSNLSVSADYQRSSGDNTANEETVQYLQARANFDRKLNKSLTIGTYLNYRRRAGDGSADGGSAGFNLRWMTGRH